MSQGTDLYQRTVALQLNVTKLGVRRKVSSAVVKVRDQAEAETDPDALRVSKELISCPEYDAVVALDSAVRSKLLRIALPSMLRRGLYLVPIGFIEQVDQELESYRRGRRALVDLFVATYADAVEKARTRLQTLFDSADYPPEDDVRRAFEVRVQYVSFDVPQNLKRLNARVFERESAKIRQSLEVAAEEVRAYLRKGLLDLVQHLQERLQDDPTTGKPKVLRESTVEGIKEWLALFQNRDVTGDRELADVVDQCRRALQGVDVEALRKPDAFRQQVASEVAAIRDKLSAMVVDRPARKFAWDDAA